MENTKITKWNENNAIKAASTAQNALFAMADIQNITNAHEAHMVLATADRLTDNIEFIRAKVLERMQVIGDYDGLKNLTEWAQREGFAKSTIYKYVDAAMLINPDGKHSIGQERENVPDYSYSRLKVFAERVKPWAKEKASRLAKMSAKDKKVYWGEDYEQMKNATATDLTKSIVLSEFVKCDFADTITPDMPIKQYNAAIDVIIGKAIIDDNTTESPADNTAENTADNTAENTADNTAENKKVIKLTADEWTAIVNLCNRIRNGEQVKELPADVVKVLTAHN